MSWTTFKRSCNPKRMYHPGISLYKTNEMSLNPSAIELMGRPAAMILQIDTQRCIIGLTPCSAETKDAIMLRYETHAKSGRLGVKGLYESLGFDESNCPIRGMVGVNPRRGEPDEPWYCAEITQVGYKPF